MVSTGRALLSCDNSPEHLGKMETAETEIQLRALGRVLCTGQPTWEWVLALPLAAVWP